MIRSLEETKDEEIEEKDKKISGLHEQLKQAQELHDTFVEDKDNEISNMKDEFQLELDKNNEFVLNQINVLRQELAESRLVSTPATCTFSPSVYNVGYNSPYNPHEFQ